MTRFWLHPESDSAFVGEDDEDFYERDDTGCLMEVSAEDFWPAYQIFNRLTAEDMELLG